MPLERPRRRLEDNIKMSLREIWLECAGWIYLVQDSEWLMGCGEHGIELSYSIKGVKFLN
jgi:hypothetical protein